MDNQIFYSVDEIQENEDIYSIMNNRIQYCKLLTKKELYGPSDICYLVKEIKPKNFLGIGSKKVLKYGSYHYVYGIDSSNVAFISAYLSKFIQKLQSQTKDLKITQSIFCSFDYFLQKDLRILIKFPGGIRKIFYIDDQSAVEVNIDELKTVLLSSFIRSVNLLEINSNSVYLEDISTTETFDYLNEAIYSLVNENAEYKYPSFKEKIKVLLDTYLKYMISTRRFNQAIINFSKLTTIDNTLVKYVIEPLNYLQLYDDALNYLASVLLYNPNTSSLLNLEVDLLVNLEKYDDALEISKFISSLNPDIADNWLSLSLVYLKKKLFDKCLRALNNIYFLKEFDLKELEVNRNIFTFKETIISITKTKFGNSSTISININDILIKPSIIDLIHPSNQQYICENAELVYDTINKILQCNYYSFTPYQKKAYSTLLDMIKEINFDAFIDLKRKLFYFNDILTQNNSERSTFRSDGLNAISNENKIPINPYLELVIQNLIDDLKIFSVVIAQDEQFFTNLFKKENLSITETKFCISIGILSERLLYYNTALKFYSKALLYCFSVYVNYRKIKIYMKLKDHKSLMTQIIQLLSFVSIDSLKNTNKTPNWIDKIILMLLSEYNVTDILGWVIEAPKHVIDFINKKVIQKYQFWINKGHDIHIIKE